MTNTEKDSKPEHAKLSPSAASRWMACPGSVRLTAGLADSSSVHAELGTYAHEIAAGALEKGFNVQTAFETRGLVMYDRNAWHDLKDDARFTEDMAGHLTTYTNVVRGILLACGGELLVEERVKVSRRIWGTADAVIIATGARPALHVVDLKYGAGVLVDVENNLQLWIYALGALLTFREKYGKSLPTNLEIYVHIVQPRHYKGGHSFQKITPQELLAFRDRVKTAAFATTQPDAAVVAGDHCRWCLAKATCPALRASADAAAAQMFSVIPTDSTEVTADAVSDLERLPEALALVPLLESWIAAIKEEGHRRLTAGEAVEGFKLVQTLGNRSWADPKKARRALALFDIDIEAPPVVKLITPAQAKRNLPKGFADVVEPLTTRAPRAPSMVPESDKRAAFVVGPLFTQIDETKNDEN